VKVNIMEINIEERIQKAVDYFMEGYGCGQAVVAAFADMYGLSENVALRLGAGFGGGVGKMRMMCGAVSGMVILAGLQSEDTVTAEHSAKADCYKIVQELLSSFKSENGSIICAELIGLKPIPGDFTPSQRSEHYYENRPCAAKVASAARIWAEYLASLK